MPDGTPLPTDAQPTQLEISSPNVPGYDKSGVSHYYHKDEYEDPLSFKLKFQGSTGISRILKLGSVHDLKQTTKFMEVGLAIYIRTTLKSSTTPAYIFDEHNHALFGWREGLEEGRIQKGALIIHFDEHDDTLSRLDSLRPQIKDIINKLDPNGVLPSLQETADLARDCDTNAFIAPALKMGLASQVLWVDPNYSGITSNPGVRNSSGQLVVPHIRIGIEDLLPYLSEKGSSPLTTVSDLDFDYFKNIKRGSDRERKIIG